MTKHTVTYYTTEETPPQHKATCTCRRSSPFYPSKQDAEDWVFAHQVQVGRARAWLESRTPRLIAQRDYFRHMATEEPGVSDHDRRLWAKLAEELDHRIGTTHTETPLF
jgi:hypothetical protein